MNVFVYGTLKRGQCRGSVLMGQVFLGEQTTKPLYQMYKISSFPGIMLAENSSPVPIKGELWSVDEITLRRLDQIEGHPNLFKRDKIELESGLEAVAYYWNGRRPIEDIGDCWDDSMS